MNGIICTSSPELPQRLTSALPAQNGCLGRKSFWVAVGALRLHSGRAGSPGCSSARAGQGADRRFAAGRMRSSRGGCLAGQLTMAEMKWKKVGKGYGSLPENSSMTFSQDW